MLRKPADKPFLEIVSSNRTVLYITSSVPLTLTQQFQVSRGYVAVSKKSEKNRENHFRKMKILQLLETGDISAE